MKIRMKVSVSGTRDGKPWPPAGEQIDLPDHEAAAMCAAGHATPVADVEGDVETAVVDEPVEERDADDDLDELRSEAEALGITVDGRWGAARLRREIAALQE